MHTGRKYVGEPVRGILDGQGVAIFYYEDGHYRVEIQTDSVNAHSKVSARNIFQRRHAGGGGGFNLDIVIE